MPERSVTPVMGLDSARDATTKLMTGRALPSLPIAALLKVCANQQAEINELRSRLDALDGNAS